MLALGQVKMKCRQTERTEERVNLTASVLRPSKLRSFNIKFLLPIM